MTSFPGKPDQASTKKAEPFWILMKQGMTGWQWHQLTYAKHLHFTPHSNISSLSSFTD